jgi:DNA-binding transcriptional LysR family regulator
MTCTAVDHRTRKLDSLRQPFYSTDWRIPAPNLSRLDLVSLRLVMLCAELGSLSAAAGVAHLSVSGASHRLSQIEDAFGAALFVRHRRGLTATREGQVVTAHADLMFDSLRDMGQVLARLKMEASPAP